MNHPTSTVTGHCDGVTAAVGDSTIDWNSKTEEVDTMATPVADRSRIQIRREAGLPLVSLGSMEIWDGADLYLMREVLSEMIADRECPVVGIDMRAVKHVPSGFFGMISDWYDTGVRILLVDPQPHVREMLWFERFFRESHGQERAYGFRPRMTPFPVSERN